MDYTGIIAICISGILFAWTLIDRAQKEGAHQNEVRQLRKDVDHAHERCRMLEGQTSQGATSIAVLSTKIDGLVEAIRDIKEMLEALRPKPRKQE